MGLDPILLWTIFPCSLHIGAIRLVGPSDVQGGPAFGTSLDALSPRSACTGENFLYTLCTYTIWTNQFKEQPDYS